MYTLNITTGIVSKNSDNKIIAPCQSYDDIDFQEYLSWVNAGNEPKIVEDITHPVIVVTPVQIRLALNAMGLRDQLESILASNRNYKDIFEYATTISSDNQLVKVMAQSLNKTDAEIQALFELAQTITY